MFAVDDVLLNSELFPVAPAPVTASGEPARIEKLDEYAFRISFRKGAGLFLYELAHPLGMVFTKFPKHYLAQFHKAHSEDIDKHLEGGRFGDWVELFTAKSGLIWGIGDNADLPSVWPWQVTRSFADGQRVVLERNPYYWKVDPGGRQLPYLDRVIFDIMNDTEVMMLKALHGELNMEVGPDTRFTNPANKPVLARNREKAGYGFVDAAESRMNIMCLYLNLTHKGRAKRKVFGNRDFRIGLSLALNREELIETTMQRQGEPYQAAPLPDSAFYDERLATQHLAYDVTAANASLDRAVPEKDDDGMRLGPDGKPISITVEYVPEFRPEWADMLELIRRYWRTVGVQLRLRSEDRSLFDTRKNANAHDAAVWHGDGGLDVLQQPKNYFPSGDGSYYAVSWGNWFASEGAEGEEPPEAPRQQMDLFRRLQSSGDAKQQAGLMRQILGIAREQFYVIGIARETEKFFLAGDRFHNVPETIIEGWTYPTPGPTRPEQYFFSG